MDLSDEQLLEIEEYGKLFFSLKEVAILVELEYAALNEMMQDENSVVFKAYHKGRLTSEVDVRKSIIEMAQSGSTEAQKLALKLQLGMKLKMISDE